MRRTSKAATAGSTKRRANGLRRAFRGADATGGASPGAGGSGAPARLALPLALLAALAVAALSAAPAEAVKVHVFKEVFGSAAKPTFAGATGMAVDGSGRLLVIDSGIESSSAGTVSRFNPDGTPANFSALGTNVIDGQGGADATPQGELRFGGTFGSSSSQIAVDTSGTATDGDIYVTQTSSPLVDVFSEAGAYLGQLTESSAGPFVKTCGVAVDPSGAVYVGDYTGGIHKFTPAANPPVKADNSANFSSVTEPCTLAAGAGPTAGFLFVDTYQGPISKIDSSSGELKYVFGGSTITLSVNPANGHLFSIANGEPVREFDVSGAGSAASIASFDQVGISTPRGVAARGTTDVYVNVATSTTSFNETHVQVYDGAVSAHPDVVTEAASAIEPTTATLNGTVNPDGEALSECLFEIGPAPGYGEETTQEYTETAPCVPSAAGVGSGTSPVAVHADLSGLQVGAVYHYRLKAANTHGPVFGKDASFQSAGQRLIGAWAQGVTQIEATLKTSIDPEGTETGYRFEWGESTAYGNVVEGGLGSGNEPKEASAFLEGLKPGTTYHYRVIASSSLATSETTDLTFTTPEPFAADTNCANQADRYGPSATLPDCRAYEMVSPVDKGGASIINRIQTIATIAPLAENDQAALDGEKLAYTSYKPFGDARGNYWQNQYIATRGPEGWSSHGISPPQRGGVFKFALFRLEVPRYGAFSEDLSRGFLLDDGVPPLMPNGVSGKYNAYLRDNSSETYTTLSTELLGGRTESTSLEGYTEDWSHVLFSSEAAFIPKATEGGTYKLYDYTGGELHLVSILPGGEVAGGAVLGAPASGFAGSENPSLEWDHVDHAVSADGSRIFWTTGITTHSTGKIYARIDGTTTIPVSDSVGAGNEATFRTADASGSRVIFTVGNPNVSFGDPKGGDLDLYSFDVDSETPSLIAGEVNGFLGASDDLSRMYFVSEEDLASGASAGKPNVYLDEEGTMTFVATLSRADVGGKLKIEAYNVAVNLNPSESFVRVTPDGRHLAFQSLASLTGYDNTSLRSGDPATEIYLYDASSNHLSCVSCNPSGARPLTEPLSRPHMVSGFGPYGTLPPNPEFIWSAAWLPTSRRGSYITRPFSDDGERLFFNSYDALVPHDTNGAMDVYEWEAQGKGDCEKPGGCLSLISTGESHEGSEFVDASEGGRDVFIRTAASIAPQDDGLIDIYDARAGGGYPPPAPEPTPCFGDACQAPPQAPPSPTPSSAAFRGAGDPQPPKARQRCRARKHQRASKHRTAKRSKNKAAKRCRGTKRGAGR